MVKALHRVGIEVILDVVFNHTTEGGARGPTICFRGFSNPTYYILNSDKATYADYTGCGNTLNANEPVVRRMIIDSLRHWVREMHVDGFRFDLAAILSRDEQGRPMASPPLIWDIETDPVLANVKLIAEAWDAGGLYEVATLLGMPGRSGTENSAMMFARSSRAATAWCARWPIGSLEVPISTPRRDVNRSRA